MDCGEFQIRNKEYYKSFSKVNFFKKLLDNKNQKFSDIIIFDVGAHKGESAKFFSEVFQKPKIYCFEPNPEAIKEIEKNNIQNTKIFPIALSDYEGNSTFNIQNISHLSSLVKVNRNSEDSLGYATNETHNEINIKVKKGDNVILDEGVNHIDILKIDVQSNETKTLMGFEHSLSIINYIIVEISFYDFYENKSSIKEIEMVLKDFP